MGNCLNRFKKNQTLPPAPTDGIILTSSSVRTIIKDKLEVKSSKINVGDRNYFAYNLDELKKFLSNDSGDRFKYTAESFDCDDFTYVVMGREKEWYGQGKKSQGSTFGIVWGDIRNSEEDTEARPHAVNFFIDKNSELWLIEPQSDKIWKPTSNSSFWVAMC